MPPRTLTDPGEALPDELAKLDLQLVEAICHDVVDSGGGVSWDDIAGVEAAQGGGACPDRAGCRTQCACDPPVQVRKLQRS